MEKILRRCLHGSTLAASLLALSVFSLVFLYSSNAYPACPSDTVGLCPPGTTSTSESETETTSQTDGSGTTTTDTTTTTTTTTTITNEDTGDLLTDDKVSDMGRNQRYGGDMSSDWGGQGPASMPSGSGCHDLGTDKCAQITGSGNSTSTMGVPGMGTTFIQTIDVSNLGIGSQGGQTQYSIKVDKQDAADSVYMHITGKDGSTVKFAGTDTLSAAGAVTGFQTYTGSFDFGGTLTSLIVEVGGRDINLAIGPLFDDVTINILYNVIDIIITQQITTVEMFVALNLGADSTTIDLANDIFDNNDVGTDPATGEVTITPPEPETNVNAPNYDNVSAEIEANIAPPTIEPPATTATSTEVADVEVQVEASIETEMQTEVNTAEPETAQPETKVEVAKAEPEPTEPKVEAKPEPKVAKAEPKKEQPKAKPVAKKVEPKKAEQKPTAKKVVKAKSKPKKQETKKQKVAKAKEKAAKKIMKKMGDKGKYNNANQIKTLVIMNVLGNSRSFFQTQTLIKQIPFYAPTTMPGGIIIDNAAAGYLFNDANNGHNALVNQQYQGKR